MEIDKLYLDFDMYMKNKAEEYRWPNRASIGNKISDGKWLDLTNDFFEAGYMKGFEDAKKALHSLDSKKDKSQDGTH